MSIRNLSWASSNESRFFPVDEAASFVDDAGERPPQHILADMRLMVPDTAGKFVYLGAMSVTPHLVTLVIMASESLAAPGSTVATVSARLPITRHYPYQVSAQVDGVGGWVAFGDIRDTLYQGRFTLPNQSFISPAAARWYRSPPIAYVRGATGSPLTGLVKLTGGNDITITRECREVPGYDVATYHEGYCGSDEVGTQVREVIVFRLKDKLQDGNRNVFDVYRGDCGKRPTSRTCGDPQPVEFVGAVGPDCDGNVNVQLRGCLEALAIRELVTLDEFYDPVFSEEACGVLLACNLTLEEACITAKNLPDEEGRLPNEYDDLCEEVSVTSISDSPGAGAPPYEFDEDEASLSYEDSISEDFTSAGDWVTRYGSFDLVDTTLVAGSFARNVATYEPAEPPTGFYKKATARVQMTDGGFGALHNAAVGANYNGEYWVAEIDWDGHYRGYKLFRVAKYDGVRWVNLFSVPVSNLKLGDLYDISLSIVPHEEATDAWFVAKLVGITNPGIDVEIGPLAITNYAPATGYFCVGSNRSATQFKNFRVESVTASP